MLTLRREPTSKPGGVEQRSYLERRLIRGGNEHYLVPDDVRDRASQERVVRAAKKQGVYSHLAKGCQMGLGEQAHAFPARLTALDVLDEPWAGDAFR